MSVTGIRIEVDTRNDRYCHLLMRTTASWFGLAHATGGPKPSPPRPTSHHALPCLAENVDGVVRHLSASKATALGQFHQTVREANFPTARRTPTPTESGENPSAFGVNHTGGTITGCGELCRSGKHLLLWSLRNGHNAFRPFPISMQPQSIAAGFRSPAYLPKPTESLYSSEIGPEVLTVPKV